MGLYDVNVSCTLTDIMKIINNKYAIVDDTLIVFQLSSEVLDMLRTDYKGKFNGITIAHLPVETGVNQYYQDLSALIKYIIFFFYVFCFFMCCSVIAFSIIVSYNEPLPFIMSHCQL